MESCKKLLYWVSAHFLDLIRQSAQSSYKIDTMISASLPSCFQFLSIYGHLMSLCCCVTQVITSRVESLRHVSGVAQLWNCIITPLLAFSILPGKIDKAAGGQIATSGFVYNFYISTQKLSMICTFLISRIYRMMILSSQKSPNPSPSLEYFQSHTYFPISNIQLPSTK